MRFDLLTIFPEFFAGPFDFGIIKRARQQGLVEIGSRSAFFHIR
jgi:tRNA (guanine37-N1)-methyltransferase